MAGRTPRKEPLDIPDLPEAELISRAFKIKQIRKATDDKMHYIENTHIDRVQPDRGADVDAAHVLEQAKGLKPVLTITTIHRSVMPSYFMPSVKDVLAQVPDDLLPQITAYSIEYDQKNGHARRANCDRAITTLYTGALPEHIAAQPIVLAGKIYNPSAREAEPEPAPEPESQHFPVMKPIQFKPRSPGR